MTVRDYVWNNTHNTNPKKKKLTLNGDISPFAGRHTVNANQIRQLWHINWNDDPLKVFVIFSVDFTLKKKETHH